MTPYPSVKKVDVLMGQVLRQARVATGATQKDLADRSCISFQQIQKYETGANRVSISRLFELATSLDIKASELIIAVEDRLDAKVRYPSGIRQTKDTLDSDVRRRALQSLSTIDNHAVLQTVTALLELLNRQSETARNDATASESHE